MITICELGKEEIVFKIKIINEDESNIGERFGKNRMTITSDISYEAKWKLLQDVAL